MKILKAPIYAYLLVCITLMLGCGNADKKSNSSDNQQEYQDEDDQENVHNRMSTYEIHISGSDLDGQTISGAFPNGYNYGLAEFIPKNAKNIPEDKVKIHFKDSSDQGEVMVMNLDLILDENGKPFPIGEFGVDSNFGKVSLLYFQIGADFMDPSKTHQFASKSGTVELSNFKIGEDPAKFSASRVDCDVTFEAELGVVQYETDGSPKMVAASVKGKFHIRSIQKNNED